MASTFTPNKNIEKPGFNDYPNSWDVPVNADWSLIDTAFGGTLLLNATGLSGTQALTITQTQPPSIQISGIPTAATTYTVPSGVGGVWIVRNTTTGGFQVGLASAAGGSTVVVPAGTQTQMWCDGTAGGMRVATSIPVLTGIPMPFAGSSIPAGMPAVFANGQAISRTTYAALFTVIGTTYGAGDGTTTFNVPDLRGRVVAGMDIIGGSASAARLNLVLTSAVLGTAGGDQSTQQHAHQNSVAGGDLLTNANTGSGIETFSNSPAIVPIYNAGTSTANYGAGAAQNVPPVMVMNYVIFT